MSEPSQTTIDFNINRLINIIIGNNDLIITLLPLTDFINKSRILHLMLFHPEFISLDPLIQSEITNIIPDEDYTGPHNITIIGQPVEIEGKQIGKLWTTNGIIPNIIIERNKIFKTTLLWDGIRFIYTNNKDELLNGSNLQETTSP